MTGDQGDIADVAVVVGVSETTTEGGDGRAGAAMQVASIIKASIGGGGTSASGSAASTGQTHRVAFKIRIDLNAHFRNNLLAAGDAKTIEEVGWASAHRASRGQRLSISAHGISDATSRTATA